MTGGYDVAETTGSQGVFSYLVVALTERGLAGPCSY
mgnify:FL=1